MVENKKTDTLKRYHKIWHLRLETYPFETHSDAEIEQMDEQIVNIILDVFKKQVHTENTQSKIDVVKNIRDIPDAPILVLPHWIMDRLKESVFLYVNGFWFACIMLCGSIIEFISNSMYPAYSELIPIGQRKKPDSVTKTLLKLNQHGILRGEEYNLLLHVRKLRDDHTHLTVLRRDNDRLKKDSLECIVSLVHFFDSDIISHYEKYLIWLSRYSKE